RVSRRDRGAVGALGLPALAEVRGPGPGLPGPARRGRRKRGAGLPFPAARRLAAEPLTQRLFELTQAALSHPDFAGDVASGEAVRQSPNDRHVPRRQARAETLQPFPGLNDPLRSRTPVRGSSHVAGPDRVRPVERVELIPRPAGPRQVPPLVDPRDGEPREGRGGDGEPVVGQLVHVPAVADRVLLALLVAAEEFPAEVADDGKDSRLEVVVAHGDLHRKMRRIVCPVSLSPSGGWSIPTPHWLTGRRLRHGGLTGLSKSSHFLHPNYIR